MKNAVIGFIVLMGLGLLIPSACSSFHFTPEERTQLTTLSEGAGFFESHPIVVEFIVFPAFLLMWAAAMASPVGCQTVKTSYWVWPDNIRIGTSYTDVPVPQQPASDKQIFAWLKWITIGYVAFRLTCLSFFLPAIYQAIGGLFDIFLRSISK